MSKKVLAKRSDNGEWICGEFFAYYNGECLIIAHDLETDKMIAYKVDSETIKDIANIGTNETQIIGI